MKDGEVLLVVLCLFTQLVDGLVIDFKDRRHGTLAGRNEINFSTFVPDDAFLSKVLEQDEHVPRVAHTVETAAKVGSDIVAVPKTHFHLYGDGGHVFVDVFDRHSSPQVGRVETEKIEDFADRGFHGFQSNRFYMLRICFRIVKPIRMLE